MEARDFAEILMNETFAPLGNGPIEISVRQVRWGYGEADMFVETDEGTFLVTVAKVAE